MSNYLEKYNKLRQKYIDAGGSVDEKDYESETTKNLLKEADAFAYVPSEKTVVVPEKLNLEKMEDINIDKDDLSKEVEAILKAKYGKEKTEKENLVSKTIEDINNKKLQNETQKVAKDTNINKIYDNYVSSAENQALKRGLARSSIIVQQLDGIEKERVDELTKNANTYMANLQDLENEISSVYRKFEEDLSLLKLDEASEKQTMLNEKIQALNKAKKEIAEFNNNVEKMQADYTYKMKDVLSEQNAKYEANEAEAKQKAFAKQYDLIYSTLRAMGKEEGLRELFSNARYADYLGDYIYDMYYALKYNK